MNLAGVLLPKSFVSSLLVISLCVPAALAQEEKKIEFAEQTSFSCEEEKFDHPVPLDESAKKALASEQSIADVPRDQKLSVESIPEDWFTTSEVHLSSPAEADLVVIWALTLLVVRTQVPSGSFANCKGDTEWCSGTMLMTSSYRRQGPMGCAASVPS